MSRFARRFSDQELLAIVADVARSASPQDPSTTTQAAYDQARDAAGHKDTPRAYRIAERLGCSWQEVLRLSLSSADSDKILGRRQGKRQYKQAPLTKAIIASSLQRVAKQRRRRKLKQNDYDQVREEILRQDNDRWRHGGQQQELMPSSAAIVQTTGSWNKAVEIAGLEPAEREPTPTYPLEDAFDDFIEDFGVAPNRPGLNAYQHRRGLATSSGRERNYTDWAAEQLRTGKASRHQGVAPPTQRTRSPRDLQTRPIKPAPDGYLVFRPRKNQATVDDCKRSIAEALGLADGERLTQDLYQRLSKEHGLYALATIQVIAKRQDPPLTWGQLRDQVIAERARQTRKQGRRKPRSKR